MFVEYLQNISEFYMRMMKGKTLVTASKESCFWVNQGPVLKNLRELHDALKSDITDTQYKYHVGKGKNDFANWVSEVLGDKECAAKLYGARSRKSAVALLEECLQAYR